MGERLKLAVRTEWVKPVWFYHQWAGVEPTFIELLTEVYIKSGRDLTGWVKELINEGLEIADENCDRNYLGAVILGKTVYAYWIPLDSRNFGGTINERLEKEKEVEKKFISAVKSDEPVKKLDRIVKKLNYYIRAEIKDKTSLIPLVDKAIKERKEQYNRLEKMKEKPDYIIEYMDGIEEDIKHLKELKELLTS